MSIDALRLKRRSTRGAAIRTFLPFLPLLALANVGAARAVTPIGAEFHVNEFSVSNQSDAQVVMRADGAFVVVWDSQGLDNLPDYTYRGIFARRYDSSGVAIGGEFQVNTYTVDHQDQPAVAINGSGSFVVVWRSAAGQDGDQTGIFGQRFDSVGGRLGGEFIVNAYTTERQASPDVVIGANGAFLVVWQSSTQDGDDYGVFVRRFNSSGSPTAMELQVNGSTTDAQANPSVALGAGGEVLVVWTSDDGSADGILARRIAPGGLVGAEFVVNTYVFSTQSLPAVASASDGSFAVAWQSGHDGAPAGIFGRRFDSSGSALATELQINTYTVGTQLRSNVASDGTDFVVVWQSANQDGSNDGVFGRQFSSAGAVVGAEFQISTYTTSGQRSPSVAMAAGHDFIVAWSSFEQEGPSTAEGVFARRFSLLGGPVLDVDGNGDTDPDTDGILVLRYLFGFSGTTLVDDAVDAVLCSRCDEPSIVSYLNGLGSVLDIDDDGEAEPLSDGMLVLRFLFGFVDTALVAGAVDTVDCMRCDETTIEPYLSGLD